MDEIQERNIKIIKSRLNRIGIPVSAASLKASLQKAGIEYISLHEITSILLKLYINKEVTFHLDREKFEALYFPTEESVKRETVAVKSFG